MELMEEDDELARSDETLIFKSVHDKALLAHQV
jgi:hypothetical protein